MNGFEEIIFDQRNKAYGAFDLRRRYPRILALSVLVSVIAFIVFFILFEISYYSFHEKIADTWYAYNINDTSLAHMPFKKSELPPAGGNLFIPDKIPEVVDSVPPNDTLINSADGNGKDTTGKGSGNGNGTGNGAVFYSVQQPPMFPGGDIERVKFLQRNINIPPAARKNKIHGKVYVSFIVEKDGSISNVRIVHGIGYGCDEEALRGLQSMPAWSPGRQNGAAVRVYVNWPIVF
jgi:periplasmic protein TonB